MCIGMGAAPSIAPPRAVQAPQQSAESQEAVERRKRARQLEATQSFNPQLLEETLSSGSTAGSLLS